MSFGAVIDVVIGLIFTYFLLALIASGLQEMIAGIFQWRGSYLSKGIGVILDNASSAAFQWDGISDFLRTHLTWRLPVTAAEKMAAQPASQAPCASPEAQAALQRVLKVQTHPLVRGAPTDLPSYVSSRNFALALLDTLRDGSQAPLFTQVERTISSLPEGDLKRTLTLFLQNAGGDLDAFRAHIETWFDDAMDRLSGIYARISQYVMILLGVLLALALNVDSVRLVRTLWQDSTVRGQLVIAATAEASQPPPNGGMSGGSSRPTLRQLQSQGLPIGWSAATRPAGVQGIVSATFGWLFTAMAVALGAPFWFSLLQQLVNFRNAGPKPGRVNSGGS